MLGTFVKDWFRYESHFVHGRDSLVDILKELGLLLTALVLVAALRLAFMVRWTL